MLSKFFGLRKFSICDPNVEKVPRNCTWKMSTSWWVIMQLSCPFSVIFTCNFVQKCCMRIGILYNKNPFSLRHWDTSYLFSSKIFGLAYVVIKKENFLVSAIFHTSRDTMKCISGPRVLLFHSAFRSSNVVHQVI